MDGFSQSLAGETQRRALHYEITVSSAPSQAPAQSLASIVKALAAASAKGEAVWRRPGGKALFQIAGVRFNKANTRAILLLQHEAEAAIAVSAHLVVDLALSSERPNAYHAILEDVAGLTKTEIEQGLQGLARRFSEFFFKEANGRFRQAHPRLNFTPLANAAAFTVERALAQCEAHIRADVSVKLDSLLKQRVAKRAA